MTAAKEQDNTGHRRRLRERFMRNGLDGFQDYEVIELLLTLGIPRKDCKPQAKIALKKFKTLKGVLEAPVEELIQIEGLAERGIIALKIIREVAERMIQDRVTASGVCCNSAQDVYDYLKISISAQPKEIFKVLYLDNRNRVIKVEDLFRGTVNRSAVYPREVIERALRYNATGLIFAHNHPSGSLEASPEDKNLTRTLVFAAIFVQVKVLDHLIITPGGYYSFAAAGLIERWEAEYIKLGISRASS